MAPTIDEIKTLAGIFDSKHVPEKDRKMYFDGYCFHSDGKVTFAQTGEPVTDVTTITQLRAKLREFLN